MSKLQLPNVTLCAVDSAHPELAARALEISTRHCQFHQTFLMSDQNVRGSFETVTIPRLGSSAAYSHFILKELHRYIETPYVLIAQWDVYVTDHNCWQDEFLQYDYIGAVWPWDWVPDHKRVGNGGFSLRSKRLLDITAHDDNFVHQPDQPEDRVICDANYDYLTAQCGIRFAPVDVAQRFSHECQLPNLPTFGFHALFNIWQHNSDAEMMDLIPQLRPYLLKSQSCIELVIHSYNLRNFSVLKVLYTAMKASLSDAEILDSMSHYAQHKIDMHHCLHMCEQLLNP